MNDEGVKFCGSKLWDEDILNSVTLKLSPCFQNTILVWIPCAFLWLFSPLEIYNLCRSFKPSIPWSMLRMSQTIISIALVALSVIEVVYLYNYVPTESNLYPADYSAPVIKAVTICLAACLSLTGRRKGIHTSGILFLFWLLMLIGNLGSYYSYILNVFKEPHVIVSEVQFITTMLYFPLIFSNFILHAFADKYITEENLKECPEVNASFLSKIIFFWFTDMAIKGWRKPLTLPDLWLLKPEDSTENVVSQFDHCLKKHPTPTTQKPFISNGIKQDKTSSPQTKYYPNIVFILCKVFGPYFLSGTILKLIFDLLQFVNPQLLSLLINFTEGNNPLWQGVVYAVLMFVTSTVQSVIIGIYFQCMMITGMRVRTSLISAIYRKSLVLSSSARRESTLGEIVNLMSVDSQRFMDLLTYINLIWSSPLQIALALYFLWNILGPSVMAGVVVMVLMIPLNGIIVSKTKKLQVQQMANKDIRVKEMNEILNGIKVLKLYAWEEPFQKEVSKIRSTEIDQLKKIAYLNSVASFLWMCAPVLVSLASFAVYVLVDDRNVLDANTAFVSISLFNILRFPMTMLPNMINMLVLVNVSVKRINKFLNCEELNQHVTSLSSYADSIKFQNATFSWSEEEERVLKNITLNIPPGSLVAIVGQVGSGKSSLISALLGEMELCKGTVNVKGSIAYVPQQAWIQNATIQQNVLFTKRVFDKKKYDRVVEACALLPDFSILPGGDMTEIGEKGINLSGGQKQRVSLARAVYNDADIYLLDDPLSAVDSHVGKHIFDNVIGPNGLLRKKTRILVSHGITFLSQTDIIIVLKDGSIAEMGSYKDLIETQGEFSEFILQYLKEEGVTNNNMELLEQLDASEEDEIKNRTIRSKLIRAISESVDTYMSRSTSFKTESTDTKSSKKLEDKSKLIQTEVAEIGEVRFSVYRNYFEAMGYFWLISMLVSCIGTQAFTIGTNIWLSIWSNDEPNLDGTQNVQVRNLRLGVYGALGGGQGICALISSFVLALGSIKASACLHNNILTNVLRAPMSFFDTTPLGRIINRFAKDIDVIDVTIPMTVRSWLQCLLNVLGTVFVIAFEIPIFLLVILPLGVIYYLIQKFYIATSRQLKRLESITRSPIYSHFSETLTGVSTIRAYKAQDFFVQKCNENVDVNQACYYPSIISNRWLAVNLEFCGNLIVLFASLFAVLSRESLDAGTVGLIVSYALPVTTYLSWLVRMSSELETNIVAVERVIEYSVIPSEAEWEIPENKPDSNWPQQGQMDFNDYSTKYRKELDLVLKNLSFSLNPNEKIGVVGRTGAGKSSLTLSLFRIIEAAGGRITIDGVDISKLGLHDLRSKLTIIPQDPVLFSGNLRFNLDPFSVHSDSEIWKALEHSHLKSFVSKLEKGLQHPVAEGGENLSVGQRQLICLARALLRKTKILILDEATAAVDLETDDLIQATIREEFSHCTIITIAHRLNTVIDYDRILVLNNGVIAEFDKPSNLLQNKTSLFYSMAKDAGLV